MGGQSKRAPVGRGAVELLPANCEAKDTIPRACWNCHWAGNDQETRIIEIWSASSPDYWSIHTTCPRCQARIERR